MRSFGALLLGAITRRPLLTALGLVAATALTYPLGLVLGQRWLLPVLNTLPAYAVLVAFLGLGRRKIALAQMLVWALTLALVGTVVFSLWPADEVVLHGPAYRDEMLHWIRTGEGSEGDLALFLPQHLAHLAAFVVLAVATASLAAMTLGAILMNHMAFYVAALVREGVPLLFVALLGWQPWALCRIVGFISFGVVLAEPLLSRFSPPARAGSGSRLLYAVGVAGILLDWILKATLAPTWGLWLRDLVP